MKFTVYDSSTGQVLFGGETQAIGAYAQPGTSVLEGAEYIDGWIANGTHYPQPAQPSSHHTWDWQTKQWADLRTLQDLKDAKNAYINAARLAANRSTFPYAGQQIAVDALSRGDIDAVHGQVLFSGALPADWAGGWKTVANTYVAIPDVATWGSFYQAMVSQGTANFAHAQALKALVTAATTAEQLDTITWSPNA